MSEYKPQATENYDQIDYQVNDDFSLCDNEGGRVAVGTLGGIALVGAAALFVGLGHSGFGLPFYEKVEAKPQVIKTFYKTEQLCVGGYYAEGAEAATIKSMGISKGPINIRVPGSGVTALVEGSTDTRICQKPAEVDAVYDAAKHQVTVSLPNNSITFDSIIRPFGTKTEYSGGVVADFRESIGSIGKLTGLEGISDQADTAEELAEGVAEVALIDSAQIRCANVAYEDFIKKRLVDVNRAQIMRSADTFGIEVETVIVNPPTVAPETVPKSHAAIEDMRNGKNPDVSLKRPKGDPDCTISPDVKIVEK